MKPTNTGRIAVLAVIIFALDQLTKLAVLKFLPDPGHSEVHVLPGFFTIIHVHNDGAAWSMFKGYNLLLGIVSAIALALLIWFRDKFGANTRLGWISLGLLFGGIAGNLLDRLVHGHVIDFLNFHVITRAGATHYFPTFNIADSAICIGVGLLFILSWRSEKPSEAKT
ncbi:MAG TPA: signal peptidase II [Candidatus Limnocylindria bacterium]|nr:signal peptidase II [Candidatus Limnocylindria bacterium]